MPPSPARALPTIYHWYRAAALGRFADILTASNFSGTGAAGVGSFDGLGPFGTYDMAGNVKEWCSTETAGGRFLLGGAWNEPRYMFADYDARGPFERAPGYGFRLVLYVAPLPPAVTAPVAIEGPRAARSAGSTDCRRHLHRLSTPVRIRSGAAEPRPRVHGRVRALAKVHHRDRCRLRGRAHACAPLPAESRIAPVPDRRLFSGRRRIPTASEPGPVAGVGEPHHPERSSVSLPVYKGTYERGLAEEMGANAERDLWIAWSRDLGRAIDYVETRPDIDSTRLAFYGVSAGAAAGVILSALEHRLKTTILQSAGIWDGPAPEIDAINYAPRVTVPTLLLNGRYDFEIPWETAQRPLFELYSVFPFWTRSTRCSRRATRCRPMTWRPRSSRGWTGTWDESTPGESGDVSRLSSPCSDTTRLSA